MPLMEQVTGAYLTGRRGNCLAGLAFPLGGAVVPGILVRHVLLPSKLRGPGHELHGGPIWARV